MTGPETRGREQVIAAAATVPEAEQRIGGIMSTGQGIVIPAGEGKRVAVGGTESYILAKVTGADTEGHYSLLESRSAPGFGGPPPHLHRTFDEAFYVLEGEYLFQVGERRLTAGPGTFVFIPRGTVHAFSNPGSNPARTLITLSPPGFERFFEEQAELAQSLSNLSAIMKALATKYDIVLVGPSSG
jgi:quercetin dioxygenase-like cupin family protein